MLRYFSSNAGLCSEKLPSDCGRPASSSATLTPASARRLHAQPPEAPDPTTRTSKRGVVLAGIQFGPRLSTSASNGNIAARAEAARESNVDGREKTNTPS